MKRLLILLAAVWLALLPLYGCSQEEQKTITAFAGSASRPAMDEAVQVFATESGIEVYVNYGGSGTMLSQMILSKSGDLYIPGSPDFMVKAERKGVVDTASVRRIAYLIPVIAVQHGNPKNIQSLADLAKPGIEVGIASPEAVCVGLYAVEILEYNHLLSDVSKNIVVNAESCEKTATLISLKAVDAVIGWDVFHYWNPDNIDVVYLGMEQLPRIAYIPGAISTFTQDRESAQKFLDFLVSPEGREIFRKNGYYTTEAEARRFAPNAQIGGEYKLPADYKPLVK